MFKQIQRFGGAMFTPVLVFAFSGLIVGLTLILRNPLFVGELGHPDSNWFKVIKVIEEGGWTVFRQMPLLFAVGIPISLAKHAHARATMASLVSYLSFNYFVSSIMTYWGGNFGVDFSQSAGAGTGIAMIGGIKTLDTSIVGAIVVACIVTYFHNRYFEKKLPDFLGIFQGSTFVIMVSFFPLLFLALLTAAVWPKVQSGISSMQGFLAASGTIGVWIYTFLERILIPTGLHHFIYTPFTYGPAAVEGGLMKAWTENIHTFSQATVPLKELFPMGGFAMYGNSKIFGSVGIALAIYKTAKSHKKKAIAGLLIPATLTAVLVGITEPLEFTFIFIAPFLFLIHSLLAATMTAIMYMFGVVGNMGSGLINMVTLNWVPMYKNHSGMVITQIGIGLTFTVIYYFVFKTLIEKMSLKTPGREDDDEVVKLYTKKDLQSKKENSSPVGNSYEEKALQFIEALGGIENILDVTNCATRLRVTVKNAKNVDNDMKFRQLGAHGLVKAGESIQVIVGLSVPQVRECVDKIIAESLLEVPGASMA